jgi:2-dehydro-3-deoxyphosphooctonate aldolase (KDO 8-P synthase)
MKYLTKKYNEIFETGVLRIRMNKILIKNESQTFDLNNCKTIFLVAGPCVIESERSALAIAGKLKKICFKHQIPLIFKASYRKANRTRGDSFRTIGDEKALKILAKVRETEKIPILTDIHSEIEAAVAADYADILQVPAFLSRQTELLEAAGETGKIVNIKKGQFLSPEDMKYQIKKVESTGNKKILVTERGYSFGYNNLVVDMRSLCILKSFGYPVVYDATHSLQMPSKNNGVSGGLPEFIFPLTRAAVAAGINGIFIETHPSPSRALSDSASMVRLNKLEPLLKQVVKLQKIVSTFA